MGGHNYVIYSGMPQEKADAATAFVKYMSSAESQAFISQELGLLPTRKSAYDLPEVKDNEIVNPFKPVVDSSVARAWIPEGGQLFAPLDQAAVKIMVNGEDTQKTLDGLYLMMAEEERAIRDDPMGQGNELLQRVFGSLK